MRGRWINLAVLVFQAFFLNVVVPGHTRGAITLDGKSSASVASYLGCPFCPQSANAPDRKTPTDSDRAQCAICYLAVRLTVAPPVDFHLTELGLLEIAPPPAPWSLPCHHDAPALMCRGPPVLA